MYLYSVTVTGPSKISLIWGSSKKDIWNKSAYIHRNSAKTLRFIVGYIRQVCALDKSAVFFSCSHLNALSLCLFSNSFFSSPFAFAAKPFSQPQYCISFFAGFSIYRLSIRESSHVMGERGYCCLSFCICFLNPLRRIRATSPIRRGFFTLR